jgi:restriction endonuclease
MDTTKTKNEDMIKLAQSPMIYDACEKIGNQFGLHIDQIGELDAEIGDTITGQSQSKDFVTNIVKRLEIDRDTAEKIAKMVNEDVFQTIKKEMQAQIQEYEAQTISNLETVGNFTVEQEKKETENGNNGVTPADKEKIISDIENPTPSKETVVQKESSETFTEPLIDQLLEGGRAQVEEKTTYNVGAPAPENVPTKQIPDGPAKTVNPTQNERPAQAIPAKRTGPDPYREPIE